MATKRGLSCTPHNTLLAVSAYGKPAKRREKPITGSPAELSEVVTIWTCDIWDESEVVLRHATRRGPSGDNNSSITESIELRSQMALNRSRLTDAALTPTARGLEVTPVLPSSLEIQHLGLL